MCSTISYYVYAYKSLHCKYKWVKMTQFFWLFYLKFKQPIFDQELSSWKNHTNGHFNLYVVKLTVTALLICLLTSTSKSVNAIECTQESLANVTHKYWFTSYKLYRCFKLYIISMLSNLAFNCGILSSRSLL